MRNVIKLYLQPKWTYVLQDKARITQIAKDERGVFVRLDQTIFHPQGGGQPFDIGKIGPFEVTAVIHAENKTEVNHYLKIDSPEMLSLKIGDAVECNVDAQRRAQSAVLHTTGHFIANILEQMGLSNPNGHHLPGQAKITADYADQKPTKEDVTNKVLTAFNKLKEQQSGVITHIDETDNRSVKVADLKTYPCGGTHLDSFTLVKELSIRKVKSAGKGKIVVGYDASVNFDLFMQKVADQKKMQQSIASLNNMSLLANTGNETSALASNQYLHTQQPI